MKIVVDGAKTAHRICVDFGCLSLTYENTIEDRRVFAKSDVKKFADGAIIIQKILFLRDFCKKSCPFNIVKTGENINIFTKNVNLSKNGVSRGLIQFV